VEITKNNLIQSGDKWLYTITLGTFESYIFELFHGHAIVTAPDGKDSTVPCVDVDEFVNLINKVVKV